MEEISPFAPSLWPTLPPVDLVSEHFGMDRRDKVGEINRMEVFYHGWRARGGPGFGAGRGRGRETCYPSPRRPRGVRRAFGDLACPPQVHEPNDRSFGSGD